MCHPFQYSEKMPSQFKKNRFTFGLHLTNSSDMHRHQTQHLAKTKQAVLMGSLHSSLQSHHDVST